MNRPMLTKKTMLLTALAIVIAAGLGGAYYLSNRDGVTTASSTRTSGTNYNPPTQQEQQAGDEIKQDIVDKTKSQENHPDSDRTDVTISNASVVEGEVDINAYANHYGDGTCTFTFSKQGNASVTKQTAATRDVSTTICDNPLISLKEFPVSGSWDLRVTYTNDQKTVSGTSAQKSINITK
jgi:hypothetical protein